jgi:uncharacterized protein with GYD domain
MNTKSVETTLRRKREAMKVIFQSDDSELLDAIQALAEKLGVEVYDVSLTNIGEYEHELVLKVGEK